MKEQVVAQRVGNRSGLNSKGRGGNMAQRPVRRGRESGEGFANRVRALLGYLPVALKVCLAVTIGVFVFLGYRAAASASFFQVRHIETRGVSRASNDAILSAVRQDVSKTGVWQADLEQISADLGRVPWVRKAVVTRVLPDGIRVRITEREPRAVIRTSAGRFFWVDEDAVTLGEMSPTDQMPTFFLRGWNEDGTSAAQEENKQRIARFLELQREWDARGLSERISEVNLQDVRDVRAQLTGDDSQIEIRLGAEDHGKRLQQALTVLDKERQTPRGPFISYVDLTQGRRALVGLVSGNHAVSDVDGNSEAVGDMNQGSNSERKEVAKSATDKKNTDKQAKTAPAKKAAQKPT